MMVTAIWMWLSCNLLDHIYTCDFSIIILGSMLIWLISQCIIHKIYIYAYLYVCVYMFSVCYSIVNCTKISVCIMYNFVLLYMNSILTYTIGLLLPTFVGLSKFIQNYWGQIQSWTNLVKSEVHTWHLIASSLKALQTCHNCINYC